MKFIVSLLAALSLVGCSVNPNVSVTTKVALQEIAIIAVRRAVNESPRAAEKARNIRDVAVRLQSVSTIASVTDLRAVVEVEVAKLNLNPIDKADANSLLNIFEALLREKIGKDEIDSTALVQVNEFLNLIVAALPAV